MTPTSASFQAAAANAKWDFSQASGVILANQPGAESSQPMTAATWILIHKKPQDPTAAGEALKFFSWAYDKGEKAADELDYISMPNERHWQRQRARGPRKSATRAVGRSTRCPTKL